MQTVRAATDLTEEIGYEFAFQYIALHLLALCVASDTQPPPPTLSNPVQEGLPNLLQRLSELIPEPIRALYEHGLQHHPNNLPATQTTEDLIRIFADGSTGPPPKDVRMTARDAAMYVVGALAAWDGKTLPSAAGLVADMEGTGVGVTPACRVLAQQAGRVVLPCDGLDLGSMHSKIPKLIELLATHG